MHWTEAVNTSKCRLAVREDREGRLVVRRADGTGMIETYYSRDKELSIPEFREASGFELEGFDDWSPAIQVIGV